MFPLVPFSELVDLNPAVPLSRSEPHPFVAMDDLTPGRRYVTHGTYRVLTGGAKFAPGDTLFARITPCLHNGKIAQFDPSASAPGFGSTEFVVLRAKPARAEPAFVYYLSTTDWVRGPAEKSMVGASGRQRVRNEALATALVPSPPLPIQQRIIFILSGYDDLIEVNRRRISLTEEIAQRLFEEWFVQLRLPGYEYSSWKATSKSVSVPKGWRLGTTGELIDFDPPTQLPAGGRKPFVPMNSLSTDTSHISEIEWREAGSGAKFKNLDTLFARITPCLENGKTGIVRDLPGGVGFGSTEFIVMRGRSVGPAFCYLLARHGAFREHARRSMSGASGRQRARTESLRTFELSIPPAPLLERFEAMAWPLLELSGHLGAANSRLQASRDLLLPRLVSGELSLSAAERDLDTAA